MRRPHFVPGRRIFDRRLLLLGPAQARHQDLARPRRGLGQPSVSRIQNLTTCATPLADR